MLRPVLIRFVRGIKRQRLQKEVFRGAAPIALLQLRQWWIVKLNGVWIGVGSWPHWTRHVKVPLGREWTKVTLLLVTQKTTSSSWAHFFLKLDTRQIKRNSNNLCSIQHPAEVILPQEQRTYALRRHLEITTRLQGRRLCCTGPSAKGDVSRTLMLLLMGFRVIKCVYV